MFLIPFLGWGLALLLGLPLLVLLGLRLKRHRQVSYARRVLAVEPDGEVFREELIADLPPVVQRYFRHAIKPGTPLARSAELDVTASYRSENMTETVDFTEERVVTPHRGGLWRLVTKSRPIWLAQYAYYAHGAGEEKGAHWDLIPIYFSLYTTEGITRVFRGRSAYEAVFVPSTLLPSRGVQWEAIDDDHACAKITVDGETIPLRLKVDADGCVQEVTFDQWNIKGTGGEWRYIPCGLKIKQEQTFGGYTIPADYTFTIWYNSTERDPSFTANYTIVRAQFR